MLTLCSRWRTIIGKLSLQGEVKAVSKLIRGITTGLLALLAVCMAVMVVVLAYPVLYSNRIYPGVSVGDIALGGLTIEEATSLLLDKLPDPETHAIELQAGERSWQLSWAETGRGYDYAGTATAAYRVGRDGAWKEQVLSPWRIRRQGQSVAPRIAPANPAQVRARLEELASLVHTPPTDAQLGISAEGMTSIP
ncbi:MAG: peptidoglycan binding domain-containing protein, partial [Anaerolineae bacterium]